MDTPSNYRQCKDKIKRRYLCVDTVQQITFLSAKCSDKIFGQVYLDIHVSIHLQQNVFFNNFQILTPITTIKYVDYLLIIFQLPESGKERKADQSPSCLMILVYSHHKAMDNSSQAIQDKDMVKLS